MRLMKELLRHKRDGHAWTREEIEGFVHGVVHKHVTDAQAAAFLMAVCTRGMDAHETASLTLAMARNGEEVPRQLSPRPYIDKHSTGGVGDKVSILLAPIAVACGLAVPMISGRGLGHTGGTLDKLESVLGFNTQLDMPELSRLLHTNHLFMAGQTENLAPADRILYALRDVTGTVENISLLTASILSKKLAEGLDGLVMDMKVGNGAFMPSLEGARALAESIRAVCHEVGLPIACVFTRMDQPLGSSVGNWLEMVEAEHLLRKGSLGVRTPREGAAQRARTHDLSNPVVEVTLTLATHMLLLSELYPTIEAAEGRVRTVWESGAAHEAFHHMIRAQGGDWKASVEHYSTLRPLTLHADSGGSVVSLHARDIGLAALRAGAGRMREGDAIDHAAGIVLHKCVGETVVAGDAIADVYATDPAKREVLAQEMKELVVVRATGTHHAPETTTAPFAREPLVIIDVWPARS